MFKPTGARTPEEYIQGLPTERRIEVERLHRLIRKIAPSLKPQIRSGMIGYGTFRYRSSSGREGEWSAVLLAGQKNYGPLYVCATDGKTYLAESYKSRFPKASIGKSCIRFKRLEDLDPEALEELLREGARFKGFHSQASKRKPSSQRR